MPYIIDTEKGRYLKNNIKISAFLNISSANLLLFDFKTSLQWEIIRS